MTTQRGAVVNEERGGGTPTQARSPCKSNDKSLQAEQLKEDILAIIEKVARD